MKKSVLKNQTVTIISDNGRDLQIGEAVCGTFIAKADGKNVMFTPQEIPERRDTTRNPIIYGGKFLSSRMKKNGNISLHGVIYSGINLDEAKELAHKEVDEFFEKLCALA